MIRLSPTENCLTIPHLDSPAIINFFILSSLIFGFVLDHQTTGSFLYTFHVYDLLLSLYFEIVAFFWLLYFASHFLLYGFSACSVL